MLRQDVEMSEEAKVHGCLTMLLIGAAIAAIRLVTAVVSGGPELWSNLLGPSWYLVVFTGLALANLVFLTAIWRWKKWGVFALIASAVIALLINLIIGVRIPYALSPLIAIAVLVVLVKPRWHLFA